MSTDVKRASSGRAALSFGAVVILNLGLEIYWFNFDKSITNLFLPSLFGTRKIFEGKQGWLITAFIIPLSMNSEIIVSASPIVVEGGGSFSRGGLIFHFQVNPLFIIFLM